MAYVVTDDDDDSATDDDDSVDDDDAGWDDDGAAPDRDIPDYPKGTVVYKEFEGEGWWIGEIESHYNGIYADRWSDHSVDLFSYDDPAIDQMVADAQFIPDVDDDAVLLAGPPAGSNTAASAPSSSSSTTSSSSSSLSGVGKLFVTLVVLGVLMVGMFVLMKIRAKKRIQAEIDKQRSLEEPYEDDIGAPGSRRATAANVNYRDDPDDKFPKII
mgnify:CR=1 FL=1